MYIPKAFAGSEEDAVAVINSAPFATLLTHVRDVQHVTHLAVLPQSTSPLVLVGHVARANPQASHMSERASILFTGAHGYISPRDYSQTDGRVPTWNYITAEVTGTLEELSGQPARDVMSQLTARFEPEDGWTMESMPEGLLSRMMRGICVFALRADAVKCKLKLGQNRSREDQDSMRDALQRRASAEERELVSWMDRVGK